MTRSWFLSGIVARRLQGVTGDQAKDGLSLLNSLLDFKGIRTDLIPYWTYFEFIAQPEQEAYFLPNLLQMELMTFNIGPVRYSTRKSTRTQYFGSGRVDNVSSLPGNWYFNRGLGGGTLYMYFKPQGFYTIKLMGKFGLSDVDLDTDLFTVYDPSYVEYLRFALAEYMCAEYGILFNPQAEKILRSMERSLMFVSPPDLSVRKVSILSKGTTLSWAQVNIGRGWTPS